MPAFSPLKLAEPRELRGVKFGTRHAGIAFPRRGFKRPQMRTIDFCIPASGLPSAKAPFFEGADQITQHGDVRLNHVRPVRRIRPCAVKMWVTPFRACSARAVSFASSKSTFTTGMPSGWVTSRRLRPITSPLMVQERIDQLSADNAAGPATGRRCVAASYSWCFSGKGDRRSVIYYFSGDIP